MNNKKNKVTKPFDSGKLSFERIISIVIILFIIAVVGFVTYQKNQSDSGKFSWEVVSNDAPSAMSVEYKTDQETGAYVSFTTNKNAGRVVDIYTDARCPVCQRFEESNGEILKNEVADGKTTVRVHMLNFLDQMTKSDYSSSAASAFITLAKNNEAETAWNFYQTLWKNQPSEREVVTPSNQYLADVAGKLGASDKSKQEIEGGNDDFSNLAKVSDAENSKAMERYFGKVSTPSMLLNGKVVKNPMKNIDWKVQ